MNPPADNAPLYAAIDLGSNSFHMLVIREIAGVIQVIDRIKRKVRLAAGLNDRSELSPEAMERGWQCLRLFAERLSFIQPTHVRIVATATLRIAANAALFLETAEDILGIPINVISGEQEAELIYQGAAQTTNGENARLVVDIGGASTELIVGKYDRILHSVSLPMGCVTWRERYFSDRLLNEHNLKQAQLAAQKNVREIASTFSSIQWQTCVGASGTLQALQEILAAQGMNESITRETLHCIQSQLLACGHFDRLTIQGLSAEKAPVFPGGLSILLAIFDTLNVKRMQLAGGALREGLIYNMIGVNGDRHIRQTTINALQQRYYIDIAQANRVSQLTINLCQQLKECWNISDSQQELLLRASQLHEIGLSINFNNAAQHAFYLLNHLEMPGFTSAQQKLLAAMLLNQNNAFDLSVFKQQNTMPVPQALRLTRLLRIAILFCRHRVNHVLPDLRIHANDAHLHIETDKHTLSLYPLRAEALQQEMDWQSSANLSLSIKMS